MRSIRRPADLAVFGLVATIVLMSGAASAQDNAASPWGPRAFCTHGGNWANSGGPNCVYYTWEQCLASASGTGLHCMANPYYVPPGAPARSRHRRG